MDSERGIGNHFTVDGLAARLAVHPNTIRNLIDRGQIEAHNVGRAVRITERSAQKFLDNNKIRANEQGKG